MLVTAESCTGGWVGAGGDVDRGHAPTGSSAASSPTRTTPSASCSACQGATLEKPRRSERADRARDGARRARAQPRHGRAVDHRRRRPGGGTPGQAGRHGLLRLGARARKCAARRGASRATAKRAAASRCPRAARGLGDRSRRIMRHELRPARRRRRHVLSRRRAAARRRARRAARRRRAASRRASAFPKALIVPHAGYIYSGPVAARAYARSPPRAASSARRAARPDASRRGARPRGAGAERVRHAARPRRDRPRGARRRCATCRRSCASDAAHAHEHSLEVQLPFLQKVLGDSRWCRSRSARRAPRRSRRCSSGSGAGRRR